MDFMMSEEASIFCRYGVKGQDWEEVDGNTPALFGDLGFKARILAKLPYGATQNSHWFQYNPAFRSSAISDTMAWNGDVLDGEYVKAKALTAYDGKGPKNILTLNQITLSNDEMDELEALRTDISSLVSETTSRFITGEKDVDAEWDSFQDGLKKLNVDRYLELVQKGYDNFNKMAE